MDLNLHTRKMADAILEPRTQVDLTSLNIQQPSGEHRHAKAQLPFNIFDRHEDKNPENEIKFIFSCEFDGCVRKIGVVV